MSSDKLRLTLLCVLISLTLGAHNGQIGLLVGPISESFGVEITVAAAQFSWLNGGILFGNLVALAVFRYFKMKWSVVASNLVVAGSAVCIYGTTNFNALPLFFFATGIALGIGVCAASTILTHIWSERERQSALVAQDALFNSGGMIFPYLIGWLLARQFSWSWGFLTVAVVALVIVLLSVVSRFDFEAGTKGGEKTRMEWSLGLIVAGVSMCLIIVCQISVVIWLPTFLQEQFLITQERSAGIISRIYVAALIGSLLSTAVVAKVNIGRFLAVVVSVGCISIFLFTRVPSISWATLNAYAFGIAIAALYHSFIAWGLSFARSPGYPHVTFLYICAGVSGASTPYLSSLVVEKWNISTIFLGCSASYGAVLIMMLALRIFRNRIPKDSERV